MGKLRLEVEALVVESFTTGFSGRLGTVRGQGASENPCASEINTCGCTLNVAVEGCASLDEACGGGGTNATCPENPGTCAYGCTANYACTGYCATAEGTCAVLSCNYSQCVGDNETCGCAVSDVAGTCYYQATCNAQEVCWVGAHSGAWCTRYCTGENASCGNVECGPHTAGTC